MSMSLQQISDRIEINDLMIRYSHAIDTKNFDLLAEVFTPDARIDYTAFGGPAGSYPEIKKWLEKALAPFPGHQHMISNSMVELNGDTATGRTMCHNPMVFEPKEGETDVFVCGLWYLDRFVRTPDGWRIAERSEESCYTYNQPPDLEVPGL